MKTAVWMGVLLLAEALSSETIRVLVGSEVLLPSGLQAPVQEDVRWTHPHLLLRNNRTRTWTWTRNWTWTGLQGRCELLEDGSLKLSPVQTGDAGNYSLEVFDGAGRLLRRRDFLLEVEDGSSSVGILTFTSCFLLILLLLLIIIFILRRRSQRTTITGTKEESIYEEMHGRHGNKEENLYAEMHGRRGNKEENLYAVMHGRHGNKEENVYAVMHGRRGNKEEEEEAKQEKEAESLYVSCRPPGSMETPITVEEENIYV